MNALTRQIHSCWTEPVAASHPGSRPSLVHSGTLLSAFLIGTAVTCRHAPGQTPSGYEIVQVTSDAAVELVPRMNNRGQIVFESRLDGSDASGEILLYDAGTIKRLTNDYVRDAFPDINDAGEIVWSRFMGPDGPYGPTAEIVHYYAGVVTQITDDDKDDFAPKVNNLGQFVWFKYLGFGHADVYLLDAGAIVPLTDALTENRSNQGPRINDRGQIVWTSYDDSVNPWEADIRFCENGMTRTISRPSEFEPQLPDINNLGHVVWYHNDFTISQHLQLWNGSKVLDLTYGRNPYINDRGDVYFIRWHDLGGWQAWLYHEKRLYQLTSDPFWSTDGDVNNRGEVAWMSGTFPESDIRFMRRLLGDMNCDSTRNGFDIEPLVLAISDPTGYEATFPDCDIDLADVNRDGSVDEFDVEPFVNLLNE